MKIRFLKMTGWKGISSRLILTVGLLPFVLCACVVAVVALLANLTLALGIVIFEFVTEIPIEDKVTPVYNFLAKAYA